MKLATLRNDTRDGELVVVSKDLARMTRVSDIAPTLQHALDRWAAVAPRLQERSDHLARGSAPSETFDPQAALSPLPRAYQWLDGGAYYVHQERMRAGAPIPDWVVKETSMYQGVSDAFLAPTDDIAHADESWGIDYEAEVAIITDAVPYGVSEANAGSHVMLVMLVNDVSLRNLMAHEFVKNFGFVHSKPASAFSPVAVTPDELGDAWRDNRLHLRLRSSVNGVLRGDPDAGEMAFGFEHLIAYCAKTRALSAGTIVGGGTVANRDIARGTSCIAERRSIETLESGAPRTPYLTSGDEVRIEMLDANGDSIFGAIDQRVATHQRVAIHGAR
jgi:fumarylacetoacetate (FAA) hydrolase